MMKIANETVEMRGERRGKRGRQVGVHGTKGGRLQHLHNERNLNPGLNTNQVSSR